MERLARTPTRARRVWSGGALFLYMTSLLHRFPAHSASSATFSSASSTICSPPRPACVTIAGNYVGLPLEDE